MSDDKIWYAMVAKMSLDTSEPLEYHFINMYSNEDAQGPRKQDAFETFRRKTRFVKKGNRLVSQHNDNFWWHVRYDYDMDFEIDNMATMSILLPDKYAVERKSFVHADVWEFFKAIGWERRRHTFIDKEKVNLVQRYDEVIIADTAPRFQGETGKVVCARRPVPTADNGWTAYLDVRLDDKTIVGMLPERDVKRKVTQVPHPCNYYFRATYEDKACDGNVISYNIGWVVPNDMFMPSTVVDSLCGGQYNKVLDINEGVMHWLKGLLPEWHKNGEIEHLDKATKWSVHRPFGDQSSNFTRRYSQWREGELMSEGAHKTLIGRIEAAQEVIRAART